MDANQMNSLRREAADRYRQLNGLLTSKEIIAYREALDMSQAAFARYLNVGEASVKRWETYFIQDASQDDHIRLRCDQAYAEINFLNIYWKFHKADVFSGWKKFSLERFKAVGLYFLEKAQISLLFLNKIHFYADFLHFKKHGHSITGARYTPLKYGPCPDQFKILYEAFENKGLIQRHGEHSYKAKVEADLALFDDQERATLEELYSMFKRRGGKGLYNLSHEEKGFTDTPECRFISYDYAKDLKI